MSTFTDNSNAAGAVSGGIRFFGSMAECTMPAVAGNVLHILCKAGSMSFVFQNVMYNVVPRDYVILPNAALASGFTASDGFAAEIMCLSEALVTTLAIRSDYGVIGHLSLLQNPVMRLSPDDYDVCLDGMSRLRERFGDTGHLFREELIEHLLMAHILDLYDIHARSAGHVQVSRRTAGLLTRFVGMLHSGDYVAHRDLGYYASRLFVTPHYLSEVCRKVSGSPATYWIDRFTVSNIVRQLALGDQPLTAIAERFNFSSLSYFSRYVQKHTGMSPSHYRKNGA